MAVQAKALVRLVDRRIKARVAEIVAVRTEAEAVIQAAVGVAGAVGVRALAKECVLRAPLSHKARVAETVGLKHSREPVLRVVIGVAGAAGEPALGKEHVQPGVWIVRARLVETAAPRVETVCAARAATGSVGNPGEAVVAKECVRREPHKTGLVELVAPEAEPVVPAVVGVPGVAAKIVSLNVVQVTCRVVLLRGAVASPSSGRGGKSV